MKHYICTTCGTQYAPSALPPERCSICDEERQFVNPDGQSWTTLEDLRGSKHYRNELVQLEEGLYRLTTVPRFAIGQSAYILRTGGYTLMWDCIAYFDEETLDMLAAIGGIDAIAISHPHYYTTCVEWAARLNVPVYLHEADRQWSMRLDERIAHWQGDRKELAPGLALYRLGGHFDGGAVAHWEQGNKRKGLLLTGDIIQVVEDPRWVSFMYSYPNLIPLSAAKVAAIANRVEGLKFDRLYNAFGGVVHEGACETVRRSAERYIRALKD